MHHMPASIEGTACHLPDVFTVDLYLIYVKSQRDDKYAVAAGLFAIEILAQCPGGGWRTLSEWKDIFATANYSLKDVKPVGASMDLLVWQQN